MPKRAEPLYVKQLETLPVGWHCDGNGLYLQVTPNGRAWVYRYMLRGKRRDMGLGSYPARTLSAARLKAQEAKWLVIDGIDPIDQRLRERGIAAKARIKRTTFKLAAEAYIAAHEAGWKNPVHRHQWRQSLETYAYPIIGDMAVGTIGTDEVLAVLKPIWTTKTETASRLRGRIETVLGAAKAAGMIEGENVAVWSTLRHMLSPKAKIARVVHHKAASIDDMASVFGEVRAIDTMASRALRFVILTSCRTSEAIGARWSEFDLERGIWTVPGERIKAGRDHRVPLSAPALAIVKELEAVAEGDFVFPGQREGEPLSNMALLMLLRRIGYGNLTVHGFRSTFSDWCAERTTYPAEVREMALAHAIGNKVEAAYRRGDLIEKRRELADEWARHCQA
jgi:integrase